MVLPYGIVQGENMKSRANLLFNIIVALSLSAVAGMGIALAQDKAASPKVEAPKKGEPVRTQVIDNESVSVIDVTFQPGDVSASRARPARVVHYFTAGEFLLTFADGKTETRKFKAGETVWRGAETIAVKNVSKTRVRLLQVTPKSK